MLRKTLAILLMLVVLPGADCMDDIIPTPDPDVPDVTPGPLPEPGPTPGPAPDPAPLPDPAPVPDPNPAPNPVPNPIPVPPGPTPNPQPPLPTPGPNPAPAPNPAVAAEELPFLEALAVGARTARAEAQMHAQLAAVYFFSASNQAGYLTASGTLQLSANLSVVGYAAEPTDRLVVTGPTRHYEYTFFGINGDLSGATAFGANHSDLRFRVTAPGLDVQIASVAQAGSFARRCVGSIQLPRSLAQVDVTEGGGDYIDSQVHAKFGTFWEAGGFSSIIGTVTAGGGTIQVSEAFDSRIVNTVLRLKIAIGSTGTRDGRQYAVRDGFYQYVERSGNATELDYWRISGGLERDGVVIGACTFERPVVVDFLSPNRVLRLVDGTDIGI